MKDRIIEKQEELIKNLTNQILMGEPQTHLQEKQYKVFCADEKRQRAELESLKQQAGEDDKKELLLKAVIYHYQTFTKWVIKHTPEIIESERGRNMLNDIDIGEIMLRAYEEKQSDTTPDLCYGKYEE